MRLLQFIALYPDRKWARESKRILHLFRNLSGVFSHFDVTIMLAR